MEFLVVSVEDTDHWTKAISMDPKKPEELMDEKLITFLSLSKQEIDQVGWSWSESGLSKPSWKMVEDGFNEKRTENGYNAETGLFNMPADQWDDLIKINSVVEQFRGQTLPNADLLEAIFRGRLATGQYATGPARDDFIETATATESDIEYDAGVWDDDPIDDDEEPMDDGYPYFNNFKSLFNIRLF
ncbi:hypothetical protein GIB67_006233 [Kingdonia uniflora]|uniref:Uncharacterized protein n=1 Tax=Kingdonia uniflora TaxID=39325 RepID=A0A7J7P585_9MAGN|nr:hypothetical protein GIB67_006233 [Kingdonia uniflora]